MSEMTSAERLSAALKGEPTDHIPFSPNLAYVWETTFPKEVQWRGQLAFLQDIGADPLWRGAPCPVAPVLPDEIETRTFKTNKRMRKEVETPVGTIVSEYVASDMGNTFFLVGHPLKTEDDFKTQLWIEEHTTYEYNPTPVYAHLQGAGRFGLSIGMLIPETWKTAFQGLIEHYAGTEETIYALVDFPDTVEALIEQQKANHYRIVEMCTQSPYEYFLTWEDSGTQNYSPRMYRQYIAPEITRWNEILEASGKHYIQHACGHVKDLVAIMVEQGNWGIESVAPPPTGNISIADVRKIGGPEWTIIGGMEPVILLQRPIEELAEYTKQVIEEGRGGPFILGNSDSCPPGVTIEKFRLAAEIARNSPGLEGR